ncbi:hypothetical protein NP493_21g07019 [Ridgeia piscesae]|uniref:E3 ubiquitin-protein ligase TM129 n=1 Tax=Ridgeia piscesae TaxID=27915 RepID=A0AAD9PDJ7_RIDPI|nr:hypothetical protein NP493_21g07019 [Ridgeia piscesae]
MYDDIYENDDEVINAIVDDEGMASVQLVYTVAYVLISICLIAPPTEFVSAGLTVQNVLSNFLGSENMNFIYYHIRRTTATLLFHSILPLGYCLGLWVFVGINFVQLWSTSLYWQLFIITSILLPCCAALIALYWWRNKWANHPIAKLLQAHAPDGSTWQAVASAINIEFRRIDKFTTGAHGRRLIVTDSWVMNTATYSLYIAHQGDIHLMLDRTEDHPMYHESQTGAQFLNITVTSINQHVGSFTIRLNSMEYSDLKDKLQTQIRNARNIVIQQSLSDRFLEAFRLQVAENAAFHKPPIMDLESCIGCMQKTANVKLQKLCASPQEGSCVQCYCRPMWCLECMGKWFASRQNQQEPETWLSGRAPCPTCRAVFCMLDISMVT